MSDLLDEIEFLRSLLTDVYYVDTYARIMNRIDSLQRQLDQFEATCPKEKR